MNYRYFAISGLLFELAAVNVRLLNLAPVQLIALFLTIHGIASILSAIGLVHVLPRRYQTPRDRVLIAFTAFSFFTPVLGIIGIALGSIFFIRIHRSHVEVEIKSVITPPFMAEAQVPLAQFGEGGVRARLVNSSAPKQLRVKALLAMESVSGRISNDVIRLAMQDDDDEVRLLAFGMLDHRENELNTRIHELLQALEDSRLELREQAELHRQVAQLYWELVYQELVQDSLMQFAIGKALHHAGETSRILENDPSIHVLLGRIHMQMKDYECARSSFNQALGLGIQESRVVPYLAELAYLNEDYKEVRKLLASHSSLSSIPMLSQVVSFWGKTT